MKKWILFLLIVVPSMVLLFFSLTRDPRELPSALLGKPAPNFILKTLEGKTVSLQDALGKPVVVNFWSTWCGSCAFEHHLIQEAYRTYSQVVFFSILYEDSEENARDFLKQYGEGAPILLDPNLKTAIDYGVAGVPETYFVNRAGRVIYKNSGVLSPETIAKILDGTTP